MKLSIWPVALICVSMVGTTAHAQKRPTKQARPAAKPVAPAPAPPPSPPALPTLAETLVDDAKADYASGKLLYSDGDYAGALVKFSAAYERSKDSRLLWNMAACEKNLRHYARSLRLVRQYLKEGDALTEQDKAEARDLVNVMEPFTATLQVNVNESGAELSIDEEAIGATPTPPVVVDIGTRKIRIRKTDYEEVVKDVPVGGAAKVTLDVALVRVVHEGRLNVRTAKDAIISVDARVVGTGAWAGVVASGGHTLKVTAPKMRTYLAEVLIQDRESRDLSVTLEAEPSRGVPAWAWIGGGVLVAGGLAAAGYFIFRGEDSYQGPSGNLNPGIVQASRPIQFR